LIYWKFLRTDRKSPFTGYSWEPTEWSAPAKPWTCHAGVHACRISDLPYWLSDELWQVELAPPVIQAHHKVIAARARLVGLVADWTPDTARELAVACAVRTAGHAAAELSDHGLCDDAERLTHVAEQSAPADWCETVKRCAELALIRGARQAMKLCGYVIDAIEAIDEYPVASVAYIAARAANQRSSADLIDPYADERSWQENWLVDRLGLEISRR
jgi:hypothetical protein